MDQPESEPPPWGTPDDDADYGTPDDSGKGFGTPPGAGFGTPPNGGNSFGTPPNSGNTFGTPLAAGAGQRLLTADTVVVIEQRGFTTAGYRLTTENDEPLGSLFEQTSPAGFFFGGAASSTFQLLDEDGALVGSMLRPGSFGRSRFIVTDARGVEVGTVEQENAFLAPQFLLTTAEGLLLRLVGGQFGGREWQLVGAQDESVLIGRVTQQSNGIGGMLSNSQRFAVQLSPQLVGGPRLLAVMATVCLDYVRDAKRRGNR